MKSFSHRPDISDIFEIRLSQKQWAQVKACATEKNLTSSWLVRYCVFRWISEFAPQMKVAPASTNDLGPGKKNHRFLLCLYGNDAAAIRLAAHQCRISLSKLVRLAIHHFLEEAFNQSDEILLYEGVKKIKKLVNNTWNYMAGMESHTSQTLWENFVSTDYYPIRRKSVRAG